MGEPAPRHDADAEPPTASAPGAQPEPASEPDTETGAEIAADQATPRAATHDPRMARRRAVEVLFEADVRGEDAATTLSRIRTAPDADPIDAFGRSLVEGVQARRDELDELLEGYAHRWTVKRMPALDRNLLRMAAYELLHVDTPDAVVIDEAVELAKLLAGDRSPRFVNGVLESIRKDHRTGS